jgi:D-3-phosphoglycerate dehydrogenase
VLEKCHKLKIVSRHGVGYDNVDLNYLNEKKIALAITGTANAVTVAEHVMTMFLNICKIIKQSDRLVRDGKFAEKSSLPDFFELYKKNIFILGFGRVGKALAKRCLGFDTKVHVYDPFINASIIKENNCIPVDFDEGLRIADFISVHMPLNEETKNMIAKDQLMMMKKTCILVNTSRGGIINEQDLTWALTNKEIYGAGIDVYEQEPPNNDDPLFKLDNIILTPHIAGLTLECRKRMAIETCENVLHYLSDRSKLKVTNIINGKKIGLEI